MLPKLSFGSLFYINETPLLEIFFSEGITICDVYESFYNILHLQEQKEEGEGSSRPGRQRRWNWVSRESQDILICHEKRMNGGNGGWKGEWKNTLKNKKLAEFRVFMKLGLESTGNKRREGNWVMSTYMITDCPIHTYMPIQYAYTFPYIYIFFTKIC